LDVDGVLVTAKSDFNHVFPDFVASCVSCLNTLTERSGADLVISSTWRHAHRRVLDLHELFRDQGVRAEIVGMTSTEGNAHRAIRIADWLHHQPGTHYVTIDDDDVRPHNRLVRTCWEHGLLPAHVDRALEIFNDQDHRGILDK
jgi:hypothetical protein